jgi:O-antigen ligase
MRSKSTQFILNLIVYGAILNTIIITPFFNKDAMIIPKLIIMFTLAMFLLPIILSNIQIIFKSRLLKILGFLSLILVLQSVVIMILSTAPIEQQIFGRTGRGLGLITIIALSVTTLVITILFDMTSSRKILKGLILSGFISSLYSISQSFGIDLLKWDSRTNGVIGTLGNPNFQSAFAAMVIVPSLLYWRGNNKRLYLSILLTILFVYAVYRTQSTQGFIAGLFSIIVMIIIYFWYKNKMIFTFTAISGLIVGAFAIAGMLNSGPLSSFLYKVSVQSRGDFWRSAFNTANAHPFVGVGLDSFGDYSLKYRDLTAANHPFAEYTDNAHNFFLEQAATGGYFYALLNSLIIILVVYSFYKIQKLNKKFEPIITSLFASWIAFQMTSVISPGSLATMFWNALISGAIIGQAASISPTSTDYTKQNRIDVKVGPSVVLGLIGLIILMPLFNTDRIQLKGMQTGDANLVIKATTSYPESTVRYSLIGQELLKSGLNIQALDVARSGVQFNPYSAGLWALILVNPSASLEERNIAKIKIIELDPLNKEVRNFTP